MQARQSHSDGWTEQKIGYYTFLIPVPEVQKFLVYNSYSNGFLELEAEDGEVLLRWKKLDTIPPHMLGEIDSVVAEALSGIHALVPAEVDEKELMHSRVSRQRDDLWSMPQTIWLTITPTISCNMGCSYCFEGEKPWGKKMSPEVCDDLVEFLDREIQHSDIVDSFQKLDVTWYGGEPLLQPEIIRNLSKRLRGLANEHDLEYDATVISNGTYLTPDIWAMLSSADVTKVQVTIDGYKETHNVQRPLVVPLAGRKIEEGSYDVIMENLRGLPANMGLQVRINTDRSLVGYIDELLDDLESIGIWPQHADRVKLRLAHKEYPYEGSGVVDTDSNYLSRNEFTKVHSAFRDQRVVHYNKYADKVGKRRAKLELLFPELATPLCGTASMPYSIVLDPDGYIHQCVEQVNNANTRGHYVSEPYDVTHPQRAFFQSWDKFLHHPLCTSCKVLPICNMVCPHKDPPEACCDWKFDLRKRLKQQYLMSVQHPESVQSFENFQSRRDGEQVVPSTVAV